MYRVVHQHRAGGAGRVTLDYIPSPVFDRDDADEVILGRSLEDLTRSTGMAGDALDDLPEPMRVLFNQPVIPTDRVRALFVRYNYVKFRAGRAREKFDRYSPGAKQVGVFDDFAEQARVLRELLVRIHLPVVLSVARRHLIGETGSTRTHLIELLEKGLGVLIQSVESFNHVRQRRFDSALTNRLLTRFATESQAGRSLGAKQAQRKLQEGDGLKRLTDLAGEAGVRICDV